MLARIIVVAERPRGSVLGGQPVPADRRRIAVPVTYTRTGDEGETSLMGKRVLKSHARVEALGAVDELNAAIGATLGHLTDEGRRKTLEEVQNTLFTVGAELSAAGGDTSRSDLPLVTEALVAALEEAIDALDLPSVEDFVLPRGSDAAAHLHLARAVARRAERRVVDLSERDGETVNPVLVQYLNRLSSLLFAMALKENEEAGLAEASPRYDR